MGIEGRYRRMKNSVDEVLKSLPDFEDFMRIASEIKDLVYRKMVLETTIKELEATVFSKATTDTKYFQNGKPPSVAFIEKTWSYCGMSDEIVPIRIELARIISELEEKRIQMEVYKSMIDVWRTMSSNQRAATL